MLSVLLAGALAITPAYSGSWFGPDRSGEGFTLQILEGKAHALWFTYPPAGSDAQQAWRLRHARASAITSASPARHEPARPPRPL